MGGEKFDAPQPEAYLFGDNMDLNFLGNKPIPVAWFHYHIFINSNARICLYNYQVFSYLILVFAVTLRQSRLFSGVKINDKNLISTYLKHLKSSHLYISDRIEIIMFEMMRSSLTRRRKLVIRLCL